MRLIEHWAQHNEEHRERYVEWANKAEKIRLLEVAEEMRLAAEKSREVSTHLRKALENMQENDK
jgi:hypothetical protein